MSRLYDVELPGTLAFSGRLGAEPGTIHFYARVSEKTLLHIIRGLIQQGIEVEELCATVRREG